MKKIHICVLITGLLLGYETTSQSASIVISKHNLSISGPGEVKSTTESRICVFCHTPHNAHRDIPYLWNRSDQTTNYTPYQSSTMYAAIGQPTGASKLCLSCHDGTIALGAVLSQATEIPFAGGFRTLPNTRPSYLGTDLSDDHPISFSYQTSIDQGNSELAVTNALPTEISLDDGGQLQCTACHDPHDNTWGNFLVMSNQFSALCTGCHIKNGWVNSTHAVSTAQWNGQDVDPWPNTEYTSVAQNGCENCHRPHSAGRHQRLLKREFEEDNCLVCHNSNVAPLSIEAELVKSYTHPVGNYTGIHDAAEDFSTNSVANHVECEDCHNPHTVTGTSAVAPSVSGKNSGVLGVDSGGQQITSANNLYEICFKCHADNNVITTPAVTRQIDQLNTRLEFSLGNPSFHPVMQATGSTDVPSLLPPYTSSSIIYCTDCHGSDNPDGAQGPHGSNNEHLLVANYTTVDNTIESPDAYALCYRCHDRDIILAPLQSAFRLHFKHIQQENAPCSVCHDAHGISASQGNAAQNRALINFDTTVVTPNSAGDLYFSGDDVTQNKCALTCHGVDHEPRAYSRN